MALLQIAEPGQSSAPHQHKLAIGIDLGTTNSLVATVRSGQAVTLDDEHGRALTPSVVRYYNGEKVVGYEAQAHASKDPVNTVVSIKRFLGKSLADIENTWQHLPYHFVQQDGQAKLLADGKSRHPIEISADILRYLKDRAEASLGDELTGAVITVPAYFDDSQRQSTKDAAQLAGLHVLRLINEPTAAAIAYGLDTGNDGVTAVYDLGGGTFDISILRLNKGVFEVLATGGDSALGGDDFDHLLVKHLTQAWSLSEQQEKQFYRDLVDFAKQLKESLSDASEITDTLTLAGKIYSITLSRAQFDTLAADLVKRTLRACRRSLKDAALTKEDVNAVVMVGGSTRIPAVREQVAAFFEQDPLIDIDPDRVVAIGAAIQADILAGNKPDSDMLLLDVLPLSLGIETMGGLVEKIIPRNTTIPVAKAQEFTTYKDGQTAMMVHVLQGERELVEDNRSLAKFTLKGIPAMTAGAAHIRVTFQVDADGLLNVTAMEKSSGVQTSIEVKPSYGLAEDEVANMLKASMSYAQDDMQMRMLREQQVEANRVIDALEAALKQHSSLLATDELAALKSQITTLKAVAKSDDTQSIKAQIEVVDNASQAFAARRMDASIKQALAGKTVDSID